MITDSIYWVSPIVPLSLQMEKRVRFLEFHHEPHALPFRTDDQLPNLLPGVVRRDPARGGEEANAMPSISAKRRDRATKTSN